MAALALLVVILWDRGVVGVAWAVTLSAVAGLAALVSFGGFDTIRARVPAVHLSMLRPQTAATILLACFACAVSGWLIGWKSYTSTDLYLLLIGALFVILVSPLLRRAFQRRFDPFEPIVIFFLAYGSMFVVRPLSDVLEGRFLYVRPTRTIDYREAFLDMLVLALIGGTSFVIGYESRVGRRLASRVSPPPTDFRRDTVMGASIAIAMLAVLLFVLFVIQVGGLTTAMSLIAGRDPVSQIHLIRSSTGYLYLGHFLLIPASLVLFALGKLERNHLAILTAVALALALLLRTAPNGSRMALLPFFGGFLIFHYISRGKRPNLAGSILFIVVALMAGNIMREMRVVSVREFTPITQSVVNTVIQPAHVFRLLTDSADNEMSEAFAAVLHEMPENFQYRWGEMTFGDLVTRPIPRALWPEKPIIPRSQYISEVWPEEYRLGIANQEFSSLFFFFVDFGYPGVIIWMLGYGVIARLLYEYFLIHQRNVSVQVLFSLSLVFLVIALRDSPVDTLIRFCFVVAPAWSIFWIAGVRRRTDRAASCEGHAWWQPAESVRTSVSVDGQ
jgi:hypothetical protein